MYNINNNNDNNSLKIIWSAFQSHVVQPTCRRMQKKTWSDFIERNPAEPNNYILKSLKIP